MSEFHVISRNHSLVPVARRLRGEGHTVYLQVRDPLYRAGLDGPQAGDAFEGDLEWAIAECEAGATLVTDDPDLWLPTGNCARYGVLRWPAGPESALRLGGWFTGEALVCPHLLVADVGPWPGGGGDPAVTGGMTLVVPDPQADLSLFDRLWERLLAELKSRDFRGLVSAGVGVDDVGHVQLDGLAVGWPQLHTAAWLSELEGLGKVLTGEHLPQLDHWLHRFVTALPVTVPPWPNPGWLEEEPPVTTEPTPVSGLTPQQTARVFWHDVTIDHSRQAMAAAQRDGLVGIARGAGHTLELSRARALEIAQAVRVERKQYRHDVGAAVGQLMSGLEAAYGVRL